MGKDNEKQQEQRFGTLKDVASKIKEEDKLVQRNLRLQWRRENAPLASL